MLILYVDEAGCLGALPARTSNIQPVFAIIGVMFDAGRIGDLTRDFLMLKRRFFPGLHTSQHHLDDILAEIKGADIRRDAASANRRERRAAFGFIDKFLRLITEYDAKIFGRVWIKNIATAFKGKSVYTFSLQDVCRVFQRRLSMEDREGLINADGRTKQSNTNASHSVFTAKFKAQGDTLPNMIEMPVFGHSDNHAGLQIADLVCSALVFPIAVETYCRGHVNNVHVRDYAGLKERYRGRLERMQFRYQDGNGRWRGGLTVSDALTRRGGQELFR